MVVHEVGEGLEAGAWGGLGAEVGASGRVLVVGVEEEEPIGAAMEVRADCRRKAFFLRSPAETMVMVYVGLRISTSPAAVCICCRKKVRVSLVTQKVEILAFDDPQTFEDFLILRHYLKLFHLSVIHRPHTRPTAPTKRNHGASILHTA